MVKVELSKIIDRPVEEVFAFATNPANSPRWQEGLVEAHLASLGSIGPGAHITEVRKFLGREMQSKLDVTAFEPNRKFGLTVVSGPLPFEITQTFEPAGKGTKISIVVVGEPGGFFKLAEGIVQKQLQSQLEGDAERLKKVLEG